MKNLLENAKTTHILSKEELVQILSDESINDFLFKTADEVQPVLNHLTEYGYIAPKTADAPNCKGRPTGQTYLVNPYLYEKAS